MGYNTRDGKSTRISYSSKSTVTLFKYYIMHNLTALTTYLLATYPFSPESIWRLYCNRTAGGIAHSRNCHFAQKLWQAKTVFALNPAVSSLWFAQHVVIRQLEKKHMTADYVQLLTKELLCSTLVFLFSPPSKTQRLHCCLYSFAVLLEL